MPPWKNLLHALASLGAFVAMAAGAPANLPATGWETVSFQAVVRGTSTVHDWSVESTRATGEFQVATGTITGSLRIPAKSLAGESKGLNEKMYAALNAATHPTILFEASDFAWPAISSPPGVAQDCRVRGSLTIAGQRREVPLLCRATRQPDGQLTIETAVDLKLTDFGIKPPTFMGFVRTGDAVNVQVRWVLRPAGAPVAAR